MTANRSDQVTVAEALRSHAGRLTVLEQQVGFRHYVLPVAPATGPPWAGSDPIAPNFQNGWTNVAGKQPLSFMIHPATKLNVSGAIQGGTIPSVVFTLPAGFRPANPMPILFPSVSGGQAYTGLVETTGDVSVTAIVAAGAGGVTTREQFFTSGSGQSIPNNSNTVMVWNKTAGTSLFDLTTPSSPTAIEAGIYAISVAIETNDYTNPFNFGATLQMDVGVENATVSLTTLVPSYASVPFNLVSSTLALTYYLAAGAEVQATMLHDIGVSADFFLRATVQRLT